MERCDTTALALYLFLVTVGDAQGLSFYADASIVTRVGIDQSSLSKVRQTLIREQLIAYQKPLYQVLALDPRSTPMPRTGAPQSIGALLRRALEQNT